MNIFTVISLGQENNKFVSLGEMTHSSIKNINNFCE
jgi:hypothetical protein